MAERETAQRRGKAAATAEREWTEMPDRNPDDFDSPAAETEESADYRHDRIRHRAYQIWENAGRPEGRDLDHWLQAEREAVERGEAGSRVGVPGETAQTVPEGGPKAPAQPGMSAELGGSPSSAARGGGRQV